MSKSNRGGYSAQSNRNIPNQQSLQTPQVSSQPTVENVNGGMLTLVQHIVLFVMLNEILKKVFY